MNTGESGLNSLSELSGWVGRLRYVGEGSGGVVEWGMDRRS